MVELVSTVPEIGQFFNKIGVLYNFFRKPKVDGLYGGTNVKRVLDTRWSGHLDAMIAVMNNYQFTLSTATEVAQNDGFDGDTTTTAVGLQTIIRRPTFLYTAISIKRILGLLRPVDKCLQAWQTDPQQATVKAMRSKTPHGEIWRTATSLVTDDEEVEPVPHQRRRIDGSKLADSIVMMSTGRNDEAALGTKGCMKMLLFQVIDTIL